ncbi:MAG: ABC transporter ATP-binding protein [Oscillospiraceae bacterium]|jgi:ABC-2 type transport system ATP-binding protein|nr:ABC transporter ATP-binding protein [Oscillospiraceae bacterium]
MIKVENLTKNYGANKAVDDISFVAESGKILGFLGPNGAGKTTTMNILTGYVSSTKGRALLGGVDILENPIQAKKQIGYLPEHPPLYLDMTVDEYLNFVCSLKKSTLPKRSHLNEICELTKITDMRRRLIRNLSKGYRQRVGLAQSLVGNPPVLILDEPTVGLDPQQIIEIRSLIKKLGKNHTVILSSHILPEVQAVCDKIVIINRGKIVADASAESLTLSGDRKLIMRIEGGCGEIKKLLSSVGHVERVTVGGEIEPKVYEYEIEAESGADVRRDVFRKLAGRNFPVLMMKSSELTLEEIFLKITTGDIYGYAETPEPENPPSQTKEGSR